jgi:hypothetical protein
MPTSKPNTTPQGKVPPQQLAAAAEPIEATFVPGLPERTLAKLREVLTFEYDEVDVKRATSILADAFREANCDVSLHSCTFMDLGGNKRLRGLDAQGEAHMVPVESMPPVGTIINWNNTTYYIAEHKANA